ncbi:MAPEG family protein [Chitinimonas sp.]|uniref:MAPEG family protein n=1 Tax=Chitinimonas sp. TaxID=1934313 RepID=UPI0035B21F32
MTLTTSQLALLGYLGWTMLLALLLVMHRGLFMLGGKRRIDGFTADNKGLSAFGERAARAHANAVENLPVAGGILMYAIASQQTAVTDPAAVCLLLLRVAQSLIHLSGTRPWQIWLRLSCFLAQLAICAYWLLGLAGVSV